MITRPDYLIAIDPFIDKPLVKIFSGVRRSGKSTILEMVQNRLQTRGVLPEQLIARNYAHAQFDRYTAQDMLADLERSILIDARTYLFLDEVQEVPGWERVVNGLQEAGNVDIYVTGSNSKLMSSEIATYLTGRYLQIPVYTLSFREYLTFKAASESDARKLFLDYLQEGGFPIVGLNSFRPREAYQIVDGIYTAVVTHDIAKRHQIRNQELFDRVVRFIIENVGKTFSANTIAAFLKSENRALSVEAVYNYLKWLTEAFIIYPCRRYD